MAAVYEILTDAAYESTERAEAVNECLKWLNRLGFNDWLPPALAFAVRRRNQPQLMERFFSNLERLAYFMLVTKSGINERIERFSRLTKSIETNEDLWLADSPLQLSAWEQQSMYSVLAGPIYENLAARARSAVLLRLDALVSAGGATYDYATITVEHVLPQTPAADSKWLAWFPDPAKRLEWVHKLGNLALLTRKKNSAAQNYEFDRKKAAYFSQEGGSPFVITTQVLQHEEWTQAVVEARQNELLRKLEQHWRLEGREDILNAL